MAHHGECVHCGDDATMYDRDGSPVCPVCYLQTEYEDKF